MLNWFTSQPLLKTLIIAFCLISVFTLPLPHQTDYFLSLQPELNEWFEQVELDEDFLLLKPGETTAIDPITVKPWSTRLSWQTSGAKPLSPPPRFA